ncbi:UDP-N-acetylglucosamine diphosphorylase/glucosamine-1-phosphate N-acetyltransferase [bacterium CPR1]|nr:UDP-N-acetylglucosamine diphosphorylase/glucosamine-1-phosphate N-acetyltransferase [bacterium CPR1]
MSSPRPAAIVLAAGKGTRMKSNRAKVLHPLLGRPLLDYALDALEGLAADPLLVVVGHEAEAVRQAVGHRAHFAEQTEQKGTGHAVMMAAPGLEGFEGPVLITYGDMPLLTGDSLQKLLDAGADVALLSADFPEAADFGRIIRSGEGRVTGIVEARDCTPEQLMVREVNMGCYCVQAGLLRELLPRLGTANDQGEYYLTDIVSLAVEGGHRVEAVKIEDLDQSLGVNTRADLARAGEVLRERINRKWMLAGVSILDPASTWIEPSVKIGVDTVILPQTMVQGETVIGEGCQIGPQTRIVSCTVGNDCTIQNSVLTEARLEEKVNVGPFAYLRPGSDLGPGSKVGDFVEIKNSRIEAGAKVPHLSYVGDAEVGARVNVGCGTITCNYDGKAKHKTILEEGAFIGSNTSLVAPVRVGAGARTGAGSVVNRDVEPGSTVVGVPARPLRQKSSTTP